jgi:hypothetical protein
MSNVSAFDVIIDSARNVVEFRFLGHVTVAEMKKGLGDLQRAVDRLQPGFTILNDLSGLDAMDLECAVVLTQTMDLCRDHKVGTVMRVVPDPSKDIGFNILSIIHYRRGVKIATFNTRAEAEASLNRTNR